MKPIRRNDPRIFVRFLYNFNDLYNRLFRLIFGNLRDEKIVQGAHNSLNEDSIKRAHATQSAWLLNINRSFSMIEEISNYKKCNFRDMLWIDVGCGNGLVSLYVALFFKIRKQYLFDFDRRCLDSARKKYNTISNSIFKFFLKEIDTVFIQADASIDIIPNNFDRKNIIYLYNPFDEVILIKFFKNNIQLLNKGSIIIYLNDQHRDKLKDLLSSKLVSYKRNRFYEISVYLIGS